MHDLVSRDGEISHVDRYYYAPTTVDAARDKCVTIPRAFTLL